MILVPCSQFSVKDEMMVFIVRANTGGWDCKLEENDTDFLQQIEKGFF